jgi:tetratricopeptide (TPR) repeat protein
MTKIINNFYEEREQALVAFYTADREALDSKKDPTTLQNAAQKRIDNARKTVEDELNALNNEISRAFFETVLNREIANLGANENELNSLKAYLSDPNIAAFVGALPDGEKNMKVVYKTYEQALKQAKKALDTDPSEAITIASEAKTKFLNSRVDIICQGIQAYAAQAQAQMLEQNVNLIEQDFGIFFTDDDKTQSTQLITQYWSQFVTNITKLYSLEANETLSDEEIQKAQKDILLDIKEEDTKLNKGLQTIQEGVLQRVESYSRTIAKPAAHGAIL